MAAPENTESTHGVPAEGMGSGVPKTYEPAAIEEKWYAFWQEQGCFTADPKSEKLAYSIVIPPPNVTGVLTLGHVLNNTIQDILARRARMLGKEVLWLPGTDHAGIATQTVVERTLKREGVIRHRDDLGREEFLKKVWEWKEKHGGIIIQQLKKLGCSCDWTRERFTMDAHYSECVSRVFVELYRKGLIYRGKRMVNWDPVSLTALSDEEVTMKPQNGTLYHFTVEVVDPAQAFSAPASDERESRAGTTLTIATTRPETIPGDTAIAVNPKDERYAHLIGSHVLRPLPHNLPREQKLIPIIGDDAVDFEFGTGVLKVTPAHDKADFEIGQRHGLPAVDIMNPDGTMNALAGKTLAGLDRFEARAAAVARLRELGALVKEEPYQNNVGYSERTDVPIEPRLSEQWFLKYPSVEQARACVTLDAALTDAKASAGFQTAEAGILSGSSSAPGEGADRIGKSAAARCGDESSAGMPKTAGWKPALPFPSASGAHPETMRFYPERWAKVYDHWMGNLQDWCISRQLWWGHRVPVWGMEPELISEDLIDRDMPGVVEGTSAPPLEEEEPTVSTDQDGNITCSRWRRVDGDLVHEVATTSPDEIRDLEAKGYRQDPDVLDTWFSSWLWPFATMGWPEKTDALAKFYPTTDLVTGPDIIFFWVARMIMAGFEFVGEMPFRNVYFTGIIRDKQGRKMSKSLGNSPDPLDLIAKYGADALRFGVMRSAPLGADILFDEKNVELGRNFCTKLWNACRFRQMQGGEPEGEIDRALLTSDDKWILLRLDTAIAEVSQALDEYRFSDAAQAIHRFFWSEFCDWYLEASKASLATASATTEFTEDMGIAEGAAPPSVPSALSVVQLPARRANTLAVMDFVLGHTLRLMHPFLPFVTEELWHGLGFNRDLPENQGGRTIMFAHWPKPLGDDFRVHYGLDESDERFAAAKYETVISGRGLRRDFNIPSNKRVRFILRPNAALAPHEAEVIKLLLNAETLEVVDATWVPPTATPTALSPLGELFLPLTGIIDVAAEQERLAKELRKVEQELAKVRAKLGDENFTAKVPSSVLDEHRQRERSWGEKFAHLTGMLEALSAG